MITLYTRIKNLTSAQDAALSAYAERFNRVARHLAADMAREQRAGASFKNAYLRRFDITARQFNAVRRYVEGLADNRVENLKNLENTLSGKIEATQKLLPKLEKQIAKARAAKSCASSVERLKHRLHQKKRRLGHVRERRSQAIAEQRWPYASGLCFGGRKLFNAQHHLRENGYADHAQWRARLAVRAIQPVHRTGIKRRNGGLPGLCGPHSTGWRLPAGSAIAGGQESRVTLGPLRFPYQEEKLRAAVTRHAGLSKKQLPKVTQTSKAGKTYSHVIYPDGVSALSWRFIRDKKGWRVMVSFDEPKAAITADVKTGVLAVDLNADHLAWAERDRFGNPVATDGIPCVTYGKTTQQAVAIIEGAAIKRIQHARHVGKPLVLEKRDFTRKKGQLTEEDGARYARMLSSLSYKKILDARNARAVKEGVAVKMVNPAYTSVLGRINYANRYGLTVHQGAAMAIGRRAFDRFAKNPRTGKVQKVFGLRETPIGRTGRDGVKVITAPDGRGAQVTFPYPEWNARKPVWTLLGRVSRKMKETLAAQRMAEQLDPPQRMGAARPPDTPVVAAA